jgi:hypothetical protein
MFLFKHTETNQTIAVWNWTLENDKPICQMVIEGERQVYEPSPTQKIN